MLQCRFSRIAVQRSRFNGVAIRRSRGFAELRFSGCGSAKSRFSGRSSTESRFDGIAIPRRRGSTEWRADPFSHGVALQDIIKHTLVYLASPEYVPSLTYP